MEENLTQEQSLIKRVVICGPESTGKSTMVLKIFQFILKLIMLMNLQESFFKKNGMKVKKFVQEKTFWR
jgi:nicotinamide riboside kinase